MIKFLIFILSALTVSAALIFTNLPQPLVLAPPPIKIPAKLAPPETAKVAPAPVSVPVPAPTSPPVTFTPPPLPEQPKIEIIEKISETVAPEQPLAPTESVGVNEPSFAKATEGEEEIMQAVVRIRCGKIYGSGFMREINGKKYAFTAAHVVIDKIEAKDYSCNVIFPRKNPNGGFYEEAHYRNGKILSPEETQTNFKVNGLDFAVLEVLPLENQEEDQRIFPTGYPAINYPFCPANTLRDAIILWGYAANISVSGVTFGDILSRFPGQVVNYANAVGVEENYLPKIDYTGDLSVSHPYTVIVSENNFAGASGGLVFDIDKRCIIGNNIATSFDQNMVFGLITNPGFDSLKKFIEDAIR